MNRKGSLNLSIEAIVIVVIAFVVLGLGLGFVREQIGTIKDTSTAVQEQISQQVLDDLRTGNKKLSFPATTIVLGNGDESVQAIGVKNTEDTALNLEVAFFVKTDQGFVQILSETPKIFRTTGSPTDTVTKIIWDDSAVNFGAGESRVVPVTITAPDKTGTYLFKVQIIAAGETFDERTFFIKTS